MTDERYKQLMEQVGMPNSRSLLQALQQVANEVEQKTRKAVCADFAEQLRDRQQTLGEPITTILRENLVKVME